MRVCSTCGSAGDTQLLQEIGLSQICSSCSRSTLLWRQGRTSALQGIAALQKALPQHGLLGFSSVLKQFLVAGEPLVPCAA